LFGRFYEEAWAKAELDVIDEVFANEYVRHDLRSTQALPGPEGMKRITADFRSAFPDLRFEAEIVIAEDEFVAARRTASGTHLGAWGAIEPTGRSADGRGRPKCS
jgi:predicted ester cyclase